MQQQNKQVTYFKLVFVGIRNRIVKSSKIVNRFECTCDMLSSLKRNVMFSRTLNGKKYSNRVEHFVLYFYFPLFCLLARLFVALSNTLFNTPLIVVCRDNAVCRSLYKTSSRNVMISTYVYVECVFICGKRHSVVQ